MNPYANLIQLEEWLEEVEADLGEVNIPRKVLLQGPFHQGWCSVFVLQFYNEKLEKLR